MDSLFLDSELPIPRDPLAGLAKSSLPAEGRLGPFELRAVLGRGGMGVVYRAWDPAANRDVALKVVLEEGAVAKRLARFRREGQVTAALKHPGILGIHSAGDFDGKPYIAYELLERHQTLDEAFQELDLEARVGRLLEACRALGYAHEQGVLHRDIKPDNILIDGEGRVRVADFGLALARDQERLTETGAILGTPYFMAPEQFSSDRAAMGAPADVWSLGVILYLALTGARPFDGGTLVELGAAIMDPKPLSPSELNPDVPPALEAVCLRCLRAEPGERYSDASALADDLDLALAGGDVATPGRAPLALVAGFLLVLAGAALAYGLRGEDGGPPASTRSQGGAVVLRVRLSAPARGERVFDEAVFVRGRVEGAGEFIKNVRVRVTVGGHDRRTSLRSDGTFQLRVPLPVGTSTIRVEAQGAGTLGTQELDVTRVKLPGWWKGADVRAPLPLPAGVGFGPNPAEYLNARDGSVLVWVPPADFEMGTEQYVSNAESPAHRVTLRGYFIGKHEVSWAQYRKFCTENGRQLPRQRYQVTDAHPVHGVSWFDAQAYCAWAGLRLPTEAEWEYAAKGPERRLYPWGKGFPRPELANYGLRHKSRPVREYSAGRSPFGAVQMAGNLWEWVGDWFATYPRQPQVDPRGWSLYDRSQRRRARRDKKERLRKVVRGGSFLVEEEAKEAMLRTVHRDCFVPTSRRKDTGFRIVRGLDTPAGLPQPLRWTVRSFRLPRSSASAAPERAVWLERAKQHVESQMPLLQMRFGGGGPARLGAKDHFGIIASARVVLPPGRWALTAVSDDGIRITVDGKQLIDRWTPHPPKYDEATFRIAEARTVTIRVEHFELEGVALLIVELHPAR